MDIQKIYKAAFVVLLATFIIKASAIGSENMHIKTINEQHQALDADMVRWWYTSKPKQKVFLDCNQTSCSDWYLSESIDEQITIYAAASVEKAEDPLCSDLYEGQITSPPNQSNIMITLSYSSTVCK